MALMGFSKLFDSMWSGSLYGQFEASAVFMVLLSVCDADGKVDMTPEAIAGRTGWPVKFINEGLRQLAEADPRSRTPDADGRRIILLDEHRTWGWFITGLYFNQWHPLILMSPSVAGGFARAGWSKNDIRRFLFDNARIDAGTLERYSEAVFGNRIVISELAKHAKFDPLFTGSTDLARRVPMLLNEASTDIVVGGDPARNQSKIYLNNQEQGAPVSRKVALPVGWNERVAAAGQR